MDLGKRITLIPSRSSNEEIDRSTLDVTLALAACKDSTDPALGQPAKLLIQAGGGAAQTGVIQPGSPTLRQFW